MKKTVAAVLGVALISSNCFGAVTEIDSDYKTAVNKVTVTGKAENGDFLGYTVVKKGENEDDPSKILSAGDLEVKSSDGKFSLDFVVPVNTPTGDCTVNIGWFGGNETKHKDIHFVNVSNASAAVKNAEQFEELKAIFAAGSEHSEALVQMEYDLAGLNKKISASGKDKVLTAFLNDTTRKKDDIAETVKAFGKYLGVEFINENITGGLEKINPDFDGKTYTELADSKRQEFLNNSVYKKAPYGSIENLYAGYTELNIIFEINNAAIGEFADIIEKYKSELGVENKDYYAAFSAMTQTKKNKAASLYIGYPETENVISFAGFAALFEKAVKEAGQENGNDSGGNRGGGSGGGGGGSRGGNAVSVVTKPDNTNNANNVENNAAFSDLSDVEWAKEAIEALSKKNIINGTAPGVFEPNSNITREQIVKIILLSIGKEIENAECPFEDVDDNLWYAPYVKDGYKKGIINGISDSEFGTGRNLTRQDLAVIVVRAAEIAGIKLAAAEKSDFADSGSIAEYAKNAVDILSAMNVINGKDGNVFAPGDFCTRAEAAKIIYNLFFK